MRRQKNVPPFLLRALQTVETNFLSFYYRVRGFVNPYIGLVLVPGRVSNLMSVFHSTCLHILIYLLLLSSIRFIYYNVSIDDIILSLIWHVLIFLLFRGVMNGKERKVVSIDYELFQDSSQLMCRCKCLEAHMNSLLIANKRAEETG